MSKRVKSQTGKVSPRVLFLGTGYIARSLLPILKARGWQVTGTARSAEQAAYQRETLGIDMVQFDSARTDKPSLKLRKALERANIILSSIPPLKVVNPAQLEAEYQADPLLSLTAGQLGRLAPSCRWAGYLSATSVYGDRGGQWAFEGELLRPKTRRGLARAAAELAWIECGLPMHIFRLAGIYGPDMIKDANQDTKASGPGRNPLSRIRSGRARAITKLGHVSNRIYVDDAARAILASIDKPDPVQIYNLADGHPASGQELLNFAAKVSGLTPPPSIDFAQADLSDMARSFYQENKKIDNSRAQQKLGWMPKFPTYRHGLLDIWRREQAYPKAVCLAGYLIGQPGQGETLRLALVKHIKLTRMEAGCLRFDIWPDDVIAHKFHVIEAFDTPDSFRSHQARTARSSWAKLSRGASRHYWMIGLD